MNESSCAGSDGEGGAIVCSTAPHAVHSNVMVCDVPRNDVATDWITIGRGGQQAGHIMIDASVFARMVAAGCIALPGRMNP